MKFEVIDTPRPPDTEKQIRELKEALMANAGQWIRVRPDVGDNLSVDDIRGWRFGRSGERSPEVRLDPAMTPRWFDVRLPPLGGWPEEEVVCRKYDLSGPDGV